MPPAYRGTRTLLHEVKSSSREVALEVLLHVAQDEAIQNSTESSQDFRLMKRLTLEVSPTASYLSTTVFHRGCMSWIWGGSREAAREAALDFVACRNFSRSIFQDARFCG